MLNQSASDLIKNQTNLSDFNIKYSQIYHAGYLKLDDRTNDLRYYLIFNIPFKKDPYPINQNKNYFKTNWYRHPKFQKDLAKIKNIQEIHHFK